LNAPKGHDLSGLQKFCLVTLRLAIGWHLLSEGMGKFHSLTWSSVGYLKMATGPLADHFHRMADSKDVLIQIGGKGITMLQIADKSVMYGLMAAGIFLLLGLFTRLGCLIGIALITLFYISMPPWSWTPQPGTESNYLVVNKNLVEILGLVVILVFPTGRFAGLDATLYPLIGKHFPSWIVGRPSKEA
jgi:thiosulfate dehydrogenase [quinone] large subunit